MFSAKKASQKNANSGEATRRLPFRALDARIIALVVALSLRPLAWGAGDGADTVEIRWHGEVIHRGRLSEDAVVTSPDGRNTVEIAGGRARMLAADCPDGLCKHGYATPSRPLICLPNGVGVYLSASDEADGVSW